MQKIGDIISKYRTDNKISLRDFALKAGFSHSYIAKLEDVNGNTVPSIDAMVKLAKAMCVELDTFLEMAGYATTDTRAIANDDIRSIARAGESMSPEEAAELRKFAERLFPHAFKKNTE